MADKQAKNQGPAFPIHPDTAQIHGGVMRSQYGEVSEAIFMNSGFCYDSAETAESRFNGVAPGFVYSRYLNPTLAMLEERLALLEGAERACVVASGMAAVFASMMSFLKSGDHVVAGRVLFGSCFYIITQIFPRFGITYELVDARDLTAWEKALSVPTAAVFIESPANPSLELTDIRAVAALAQKAGARVIVDNIFATPYHQRPLELGADVVVYSTTKHMDGQGRTLGGAIMGSKDFIENVVTPFHRHTGPALSPFNAWVILKGLETFGIRMERHSANAESFATMLDTHPKIARTIYPGLASHPQHTLATTQMHKGFGNLIAFEVKGGKAAAFTLLNKLSIILISNNLGDAKSLMTHPATTTHSNMKPEERAAIGINDAMLRLSVGLEHIDDLLRDMNNALEAI
ncbi:MAG: O-succinylhomoserine sulfhydrylase [Alphaproteobacteria bacterium]|nr:O-succinylhomoserine sulfhydrylase [Alphaproteobacteria bacterium]